MSESQLKANRENAAKSTGPRTEEGKRASAANSLRHGLRSNQICVLPGEEDAFEELRVDLIEEIHPSGELEALAFEKLLHAAWSLRRVRVSEATLTQECIDRGVDPLLDDLAEPKFRRLADYQRRAESSFSRAMRELRTLQTDRQIREEAPAAYDGPDSPGLVDARAVRTAVAAAERASSTPTHRPVRTKPNPRHYDPM